MKQSKAYKWIVLAILVVGSAILYYSNMIFAVRHDTMPTFNIGAAELTAISTIGCLPGAFLSVLIGKVLDDKGVKKVHCSRSRAYCRMHGMAYFCTYLC